MTWNLFQDLEHACSQIKHDPDSVDLDYIRGLLRQAQDSLTIVSQFKNPTRVDIGPSEYGEGLSDVRVIVTTENLSDLVRMLWPDE